MAAGSEVFNPMAAPPEQDTSDSPPSNPSNSNPYGNNYGYSYSGYGRDSGPSDEDKESFGNLGAVTGYNAETLRNQYEDQMKVYDIADKMNQGMRDESVRQARQKAGSDWFQQHLKLQRTASSLNDRSGNAMRGSYLYDYRDLLGTADDLIDSETLDTARQNIDSVLLSYFESQMDDVNNRNQAALNTEQGLRELYADYIAQGNNIHPDLVASQIDAKNHALRGSDWLKTEWFDDHLVQAAKPAYQGMFRPDSANHDAREKDLKGRAYNTRSSANMDYWERMNRGYDQRERQA